MERLFLWMMMMVTTMCLVKPSFSFSGTPLTCNPSPSTFLHHLHHRCPLKIPSSPPIQMDGEYLEQVLSFTSEDVFNAVLFYDSRSSFSSSMRYKFDILSSMFPQVAHIAVERSMVMPSLFSRFGIHSLPALFIMNQALQIRYYGPKQLYSLVHFYQNSTGLDPAVCHSLGDDAHIMDGEIVPQPWYQSSWIEIIVKETYLVFAILFLVSRGFYFVCPKLRPRVTTLWMFCKSHINLGIFGESNQLLGRVAHLMDVKKVWSRLKLCKTRNFQKGARSARVLASSLASVALSESSSARPSPSIES